MTMSFRAWLEAIERKAPEKKGRPDKDTTTPMDFLGATELELDIEPDKLKHIYQTEPQVGAHVAHGGMDWKLMPYKLKDISPAGADIENMGNVRAQAFKGGKKIKKPGVHHGFLKRKPMSDLLGQGWTAVQPAAGAGGAPGMGGGLGLGI